MLGRGQVSVGHGGYRRTGVSGGEAGALQARRPTPGAADARFSARKGAVRHSLASLLRCRIAFTTPPDYQWHARRTRGKTASRGKRTAQERSMSGSKPPPSGGKPPDDKKSGAQGKSG